MSTFMLPRLPYLRLRAVLRPEQPARLPPYLGSTLRGAFGHALREAVCSMGPEQPCPSCPLRRACAYPRLFECLVEGEPPPFLKGLKTAPRPYVFEAPSPWEAEKSPLGTPFAPEKSPLGPPFTKGGKERQGPASSFPPLKKGAPRGDFPGGGAGDEVTFDLLLFGQAVELQAYAAVAVERMAGRGLGAGRVPFRLVSMEAVESRQVLFEEGEWKVGPPAPAVLPQAALPAAERATLHLVTPLRILRDGDRVESFTFRHLAFRMLRRQLELAHFHLPGAEISWEIRPLLEAADRVRITKRDVRLVDWKRYSNRQQRSMRLGGLVGRLELEGDLAPFAGLLKAAELTHVGKGATFGLGWVRVS